MSNNNISSEWKLTKFSLPSNAFYGNKSVKPSDSSSLNSFVIPTKSASDWKSSKTSRTTFTQSSSRTIVEETFLKQFGPISEKRRCSTDSRRSLLSLPLTPKNMEVSRNRSNRSASPDWATCRFSLPAVKKNEELHQDQERKRRSISKEKENDEESKKENRHRSVSPDWNTSRFSLPPLTPRSTSNSPKKKKTSPAVNGNSPSPRKMRSPSPDWNTSRFALPKASVAESFKSPNKKVASVSPRITAPLAHRFKTKSTKNAMYTISQKTLDKLLPKPEIHLFDVVKYGPTPQHKDDFLFGLNLMRSEVLNKIDLLHYKKKLRNTGMNFIRTFQLPKKSRSKSSKSDSDDSKKNEEPNELIVEILDQPDEIVTDDVDKSNEINATIEIDKPEEIIQIDDDSGDKEIDIESEKLLEEAIQDFADKFDSEVIEETTEKSNVIDSNISSHISDNENANETVKISETNTFYHSVTKKHNRNSLDSKIYPKSLNQNKKRNSLPNINIKKNGVPKKKPLPNKKKNIIKVKWPIARKSLLDLRNNS